MTGAVARIKEEIRNILVVALFFSIGFCLIHLCTWLLTEGSNVQLNSLARAAVGGLIVAKVLVSIDLLPFIDAFPNKPLVHNIAWKSSLYVAGGIIFLYLEPFVKNLFKGIGLYASHSRAWHELMLPRTQATVIYLGMLMVVFVTMMELRRVIGKERFVQMFVGPRGEPASERQFRGAA